MAENRPSVTHRLLATALMRREAAPVRTKPAYRPPPAIGARLRPVVSRLWQAKAPGHAGLMLHWPEIVGPELAAVTEPGTLKEGRGLVNNGVLTIRAAGPVALELQHRETQILERVNAFLGYRAAGRLKLVQAPLQGRAALSPPPPRPAPSAAQEARSAGLAVPVRDGALRAALARLGAQILAETTKSGEKP
jgi:hypothetical protein